MKMLKIYVSLIIVLLAPPICWSQEYHFQHLTTVDGLSHNEVRKIVKDDKGFLWFGTQNGLSRYDGYRFKIFKNLPDDETSIIGDKIYTLATSKDKLWVGTVTGLSVINTATLEVVQTPDIFELIGTNSIQQLYCDGSNLVWVSTEKKNFIIDNLSLEITQVLEDYKIAAIAKGYDNTYWIGTDKGLLLYDFENSLIIKTYGLGAFDSYGLDEILTNTYGEVWITIGSVIYRYQSERDRFIEIYRAKSLNSMSQNNDGDIFFGSYGDGLLKYSRTTGEFKSYQSNPESHQSISSNDVYDVYVDNEGIVWVGTQEGLDFYDFTRHRFKSLIHLPGNKNSLRSNFVQTLFQDINNIFWIGTREGIDHVKFEEGYSDPKITHIDMGKNGSQSLNSDYITSVYRDSKERLWIATMSNGLFVIKKGEKVFTHFLQEENQETSIASSSVRSILEDHLGRMWFGTGRGLSLLDEQNDEENTFENFSYSKLNTNSLPSNDIQSVFEDSKNRIWIGTNEGGLALLKENGSSKRFLRFKHDPSDFGSISNDEVFVIYEDAKQRVWFGTSAAGLNLLKEDGNKDIKGGYYFQNYTETDGLSDNEINAILEDDEGDLWIATNTGFSEFNIATETFTNYSTYDGVLKGKFRKNAKWKTKDGTLFFGGTAGVNYFNPDDFTLNKIPPKPIFLDLLIDGKVVEAGHLYDDTAILEAPLYSGSIVTLPEDDNRFEIEFASLSFASPLRNQYAFKLIGFDKDWRYATGKNPSTRYSNLKPGNYRFYLKASNNDGIWNEDPIYLDIVVRTNFMNTNKIKVVIGVLLFITLALAIVYFKRFRNNRLMYKDVPKLKKLHKQVDPKVEAENKEKIKELNLLMEEDKIYLNSELGLGHLAKKIGVSTNHLSVLLNDYIGKNFYDYINHFRVEEVKRRLKDPRYQNHTISSIGGDCGFNSKSAFNRIFKNLAGMTPSQYQKKEH
ncbi:two-component regulator propeller domain-containing protein [Maribacter ulvicola]|uniref:Two component regulator propeller n=1 Tax=Maribacter ulvicola TaxID=228959 RepID=A0A1N6ZZY4_9FLAO|nr:two-component regulator propeller domain-containing protein [Maribacter ulvicola]SIR32371.1 Two component regulator propeller [Maribacter ulvicola]